MIRTEIFIENYRLDLNSDISAEFTYNIDDIKDFSARNTNFSKTIILPGNATNNKLFGHIFEFGSGNFYNPNTANVGYNYNAAKSASCIIYVDKIQIFKGVIRLLEIVIDRGAIEYECAVFGELGGFISAVGNRKIEDLDFSAYNHDWTITNIENSWDLIDGQGYFYPLIDYGNVSTNKKDFDVRALRPALYVREYIDKIITNSGYTYESSFFDTNLFKRLVIPNNTKNLSTSETLQLQADGDSYPLTLNSSISTQSFAIDWATPTKYGGFSVFSQSEFEYFTIGTLVASANIYLNGSINVPDNESGDTYLDYYKNGSLVSSHLIANGRVDDIDKIVTAPISVTNGDLIQFKIRFVSVTDTIQFTINEYNLEIRTSSVVDTPLVYGEFIEVNKTIPKGIFQRDFFASIIKMFNLYVVESSEKSKHLIITPFIDFYNAPPVFLQVNDMEENLLVNDDDLLLLEDGFKNFLDWTPKVDRAKPFRIKPMSELNGRYFEYKYKQDNDYYNEFYQKKYGVSYGDYLEDTGYEFANDKQTAEIIFAPTPLSGYVGEVKVFPAIYKLTNTQNTQSEDSVDSVIRILQAKKIEEIVSWQVKNGMTILGSFTKYGYGGHLDDPDAPSSDINFGAPKELYFNLTAGYPDANLYNGFWSDYIAEITDKNSKLLTCSVYLNDVDIFNLNFAKLIMIDGNLWRLNKIIDYNPIYPNTTKCEFLKVIELTYA